jgi:hypothetical protein
MQRAASPSRWRLRPMTTSSMTSSHGTRAQAWREPDPAASAVEALSGGPGPLCVILYWAKRLEHSSVVGGRPRISTVDVSHGFRHAQTRP